MPEPSAPTAVDPASLGFERVRYAKDTATGVATVTIDRPQVLNAFDFLTLRELGRAFEDASWDDSVAVVVVTGAGERAFCTGADLDEQAGMGSTSGQYWRWMGAFIEMHDRLRNIGKPTIARINGACVGGGNELQMACDLSVMSDDAYIRHVGPEHGSVPAGGATQWLPILVGDRRAREILMLCEPISPGQALEWGLVNRVVPADQLDSAVLDLASVIASKPPNTTSAGKRAFYLQMGMDLTRAYQLAGEVIASSFAHAEGKAGMEAFIEKRPPPGKK